jgi:hypothetical protein
VTIFGGGCAGACREQRELNFTGKSAGDRIRMKHERDAWRRELRFAEDMEDRLGQTIVMIVMRMMTDLPFLCLS